MLAAVESGFRHPGEFAVDGVELGVIQTALEIMVAVGHRPGDAAFRQRRRELGDHAADLLTRALQVRRHGAPPHARSVDCWTTAHPFDHLRLRKVSA